MLKGRSTDCEDLLRVVSGVRRMGQAADHRSFAGEFTDQPAESSAAATAPSRAQVLIIEDNRADVFLVERAVEFYNVPANMRVLEDGEQAIRYIDSLEADPQAPLPALLLLDLNLPKRPGTDVLKRLRAGDRCRAIPVIVLTSSDSADDRRMASQYGASRYFRKPTSYDEFLKIGQVMNEVLASGAAAPS